MVFEDRVQVIRELKTNGRGRILLVRDRASGERLILRELRGGGQVYRRLLDVREPCLPRILAVEEHDGVTAVLEEYIQGDALSSELECGPLPREKALDIAVQLCRALEILHGLEIVHRDIKPENVILRGGDAVLIDFDVSRVHKQDADTDTDTRVMGTAGYAAPEQFGFSQTDARADIFSMGVLLNEMLTGRHPSTRMAPGLAGCVVQKCVEVNVGKRYPSARALREALENADREPGKKRRRRLLAAAALVLAAAAVLLWRLSDRREPLAISGTVSDDKDVSRVEFTYDLDGDGTEETYLFAVVMDLPGRKPGGTDSRMLLSGDSESVTAAPGVWRRLEDGSYEQAFAFGRLLQEPRTQVWCRELWGPEEPALYAAPPLDGTWNGAVEAVYTGETAGIWRYTVSALLDGEPLAASAVTVIEKTDTYAF